MDPGILSDVRKLLTLLQPNPDGTVQWSPGSLASLAKGLGAIETPGECIIVFRTLLTLSEQLRTSRKSPQAAEALIGCMQPLFQRIIESGARDARAQLEREETAIRHAREASVHEPANKLLGGLEPPNGRPPKGR